MTTAQLRIFDEEAETRDGGLMHGVSFKWPWYQQNQVIGLMGCSIILNPATHSLADNLAGIMRMGLLDHTEFTSDIYFTRTEKHVLHYLAQRLTAKEIALRIGISHRTVEKHIANCKTKVGAHTRLELIQAISRRLA